MNPFIDVLKVQVITDETLMPRKNFLHQVERALIAGAKCIQFREKRTGKRDRADLGVRLVEMTERYGAKVIVNDDPWLAARIKAHGVHLGRNDADIFAARQLLGKDAIIGASCYGDVALAKQRQIEGADYVSFGAIFKSPTKPKEPVTGLSVVSQARRMLRVPVIAIGGINAMNAAEVLAAGAHGIAVVSSVFSGDPSRKLKELLGAVAGQ